MQLIKVILLLLSSCCTHLALAQSEFTPNWEKGYGKVATRASYESLTKVLMEPNNSPITIKAILLSYKESPEEVATIIAQDFKIKSNINFNKYELKDTNWNNLFSYFSYRSYKDINDFRREMISDSQKLMNNQYNKINMQITHLSEIKLVSYKVNIYDAQDIIKEQGSIVFIFRIDEFTKWGWSSGHSLFSFGKNNYATTFVDSVISESVIDNKDSKLGLSSIYSVESRLFTGGKINTDVWLNIKKCLKSICSK